MTIPLEGVETAFVPETNDGGKVKEGIIGVQEEEDDRTEAPQACGRRGYIEGPLHCLHGNVMLGLLYHDVNFFQAESTGVASRKRGQGGQK